MEQKPLLLETVLGWTEQKAKAYRVPLLASFFFGLLAYMFTFTNKLVNHDEVYSLFEMGGTVGSGRWGLEILERLFPSYSMPWLYGVLTIGFLAVAVCIICHIFEIRSRLLQVLLAGSILVFPSLISTFAYMFTSSAFGLSFLLAVLAVLLIREPSWLSGLLALGCMVFSLSIYQSYVSLAAGLLLLILIQRLLQKDDVKAVLQRGFVYLAFLAASLGIYYIATKMLLFITGAEFNVYASGNLDFSLSAIPGKIVTAYKYFIYFFLDRPHWLIPTALSQVLHWVLAFAIAGMLLAWLLGQRKKDFPRVLLLALLLVLLPLAVNCMYLFTAEGAVHTLVLYGFVSIYILAVILAQLSIPDAPHLLRRVSREGAALVLALLLLSNIHTANAVSLKLYLRYENAYAFYTALSADIQRMPEFDENTRIAVVGHYEGPAFYSEEFGDINELTGTTGFIPSNYSNQRFLEYYIGLPIPFASGEEIQAISASPEYAEMPVYPYYGSMKFFGDILVVKLS